MKCPLCDGPLHVEDGLRFVCERGHGLDPEAMRVMVGARVTRAFWMAITALETEADALRTLSSAGSTDGLSLAEQAEADARLLRELAARHLPEELRTEGRSDG